jgi:serine protease
MASAILGVVLLAATASAAAPTSHPDDYYFAAGRQWALSGAVASINAPAAWCVSTGAGVLIADIDSGADFSHEDLAGQLVAGAAFLNAPGDASGQMTGTGAAAVADDNGHGTLTTGLLVARTNNRRGIAAVAPDAKALIVKVIGASGRGNATDVAAGMRWAVDHGAKVINASIAATQFDFSNGMSGVSPIADAVDYAAAHGVAVAFAAGNDSAGFNSYQLLEEKPNALVAGALARDGSVPSYSNGGASIYAPGGDAYAGSDPVGRTTHNVVSTYTGNEYATAAGTSVATPMVAGVLALLMARGYSAEAAKQRVLGTSGTGAVPVLNAAAALGTTPSATCGKSVVTASVRAPSLRRTTPELTPATTSPTTSTPLPKPTPTATASIELALPSSTPGPLAADPTRQAPARSALLVLGALAVIGAAASVRRFR